MIKLLKDYVKTEHWNHDPEQKVIQINITVARAACLDNFTIHTYITVNTAFYNEP